MSSSVPSSDDSNEVVYVDPHASGVKCDGGNGPLGHPVVYYAFDGSNSVRCGYCDRIFIKE